jgi:hypothetical protein
VRARLFAAVLVAALAVAPVGFAAAARQAAPAKAKGPPDFSGVWLAKSGSVIIRNTSEGWPPPFQPWSRAIFDKTQAAEKNNEPIADNVTNCLPHGVPRIMGAPFPIKIMQTPKEVVMIHEAHHMDRFIYLNEKHPADLDPTYMGHSVGKWEGDTLMVDTIGRNDKTVIDRNGIVNSDALHVIEHFRLIEGGKVLEDTITVDDPKVFTKPWSYKILLDRRPDVRLMEYICDNNLDVGTEGQPIAIGTGTPLVPQK